MWKSSKKLIHYFSCIFETLKFYSYICLAMVHLNLGQIYMDGQMCMHLQKQWVNDFVEDER